MGTPNVVTVVYKSDYAGNIVVKLYKTRALQITGKPAKNAYSLL